MAGLVGAGRTEVTRAIFGADPLDGGTITKDGRTLDVATPADAMKAGIAYLPEDRKTQGLVLSLSGYENLIMTSLKRHSPFGVVSWRGVTVAAREVARRLQFRGNLGAAAWTNSGGNQQKLVIGKWVLSDADVLIFDEPTRGIDVGAKAEIYRLIHELAGAGRAVIVVSSEIMELVNLCHRIVVMSGGRIYDEMNADEFDDRRILDAAFAAHVSVPGSSSERFVRASGHPT
jgi:ABC-type sugar transport system ATPase subunit